MFSIFKREFKSYFTSLWGYVFLAGFLALSALSYVNINLANSYGGVTYLFQDLLMWVMFILPILTMRIFSEDKRQKTDQLLLTAPISTLNIVMGKFLAVFTVFMVGIVVTIWYPFSLSFYGDIPVAATVSVYVGFLLYCATILAVGVFMSSLTESQVIAAIATYAFVLGTVFAYTSLSQTITNPVLAEIVSWFSIMNNFTDFTLGVLSVGPILYYVSMIAIFLCLTNAVLQRRRFS